MAFICYLFAVFFSLLLLKIVSTIASAILSEIRLSQQADVPYLVGYLLPYSVGGGLLFFIIKYFHKKGQWFWKFSKFDD
ncbi:MAG: hypothetical protein COA58_03830 [Bacteroidetes bacterium]|nr:MAG: hypothetical protein COA58_03830 [Bacteroidota bacterium]